VAMLEPLSGAVFALPIAHEPLRREALLGGALVLFGVYLNRR
ncbi:MAG: permease, partial [Thermoleophilia bacterium]